MVLKFIIPIVLGAALTHSAAAAAADYRPDEFLKLDLAKAVLSPKPLGPAATFEPVPIEAKTDPKTADQPVVAAQPEVRPDVPRAITTPRVRVARPLDRPHGMARTKLVHRRGNPLDAQAMDSRIQTWPCRPGSGGICGWK